MSQMARRVGIHELKTHFSRLLRDVEDGGEIIVTRSGKPVARIVSAQPSSSVAESYGLFRGQFVLPDDFDAGSDELADLFGVRQ
jgi:prevent-host-death family protein